MSLTRKALVAMGIEAEKIDQIIEMHSETVNAIKAERDAAQEEAKKYKADSDKLSSTEKELEELKEKANQPDAYKEKYEKVKKEYDDYKGEITAKESKEAKKKAYRDMLKEVGISDKRLDTVIRCANLDSIELEDGKIKGVEDLKNQVAEEWSEFIVKEGIQGAQTPTPPSNTGGEDNKASDAAKRAMAYRNERYGVQKEE